MIIWYDGLMRYARGEAQRKEEQARDAAEDEARAAAAMDWESGAGLEEAVEYIVAEGESETKEDASLLSEPSP